MECGVETVGIHRWQDVHTRVIEQRAHGRVNGVVGKQGTGESQ
jgi:hypothetical protein